MNINSISETALITLSSRVIESRRENPVLSDPVGEDLYEKIKSMNLTETQKRILTMKLPPSMTSYTVLRARKYDSHARDFSNKGDGALVISLGCGFDTRYWRVSSEPWNYIELDLPEVMNAKTELLGDKITYKTIRSSVLDYKWIDDITAMQKQNILFIAEGLFMYLPEKEMIALFQKLASTFSSSKIVFEAVAKKYTQGTYKKMVEAKMKRRLGTDAGASYNYGLSDASEIETYADNIRVTDEWSYFEDEDIRPKFQYFFRHFKTFTRTQWSIAADII